MRQLGDAADLVERFVEEIERVRGHVQPATAGRDVRILIADDDTTSRLC